jgi:phospholipid/cholesterol/gamma-HCH transport system substrate-binding protein
MATTATNHWKLGLFVVVGIGAFIGTLFWLGAERFQREAFPAVTYFDESVQGLDVGSPVKFRGVTMGTVSNITLAPDHRHVQVTADIYVDAVRSLGISNGAPERKGDKPFMPDNLRVQLAAAGITGVRFLEVDFFDPMRYPRSELPFQAPWNYIPSAPSTLRSLEQAALEFANRLPALGDETTAALAEGRATMIEGRATLSSMRELSDELQGQDGAVNRLVARLDSTATVFEQALRDFQPAATTAALRDASSSVTGAANGVGQTVGDVREELRSSLVALRETLDSVRALVESLDRDPSVLVRGRRADDGVPEPRR